MEGMLAMGPSSHPDMTREVWEASLRLLVDICSVHSKTRA